jgi:hypothetical protein
VSTSASRSTAPCIACIRSRFERRDASPRSKKSNLREIEEEIGSEASGSFTEVQLVKGEQYVSR